MIIKLEPVFFDKIWGGSKLSEKYKYKTSNKTGECWGISAHKNGSSTIDRGVFKGMTLKQLFEHKKDLFGNYKGLEFPILVKLIDATNDLSIQVHPNDEYAKKYNNLGKEECWYILDVEKDTNIIIGHTAKTKEEFVNAINSNLIEEISIKHKIKKNDFFYIKSGTLHAICKGTTLLEVQQSSDVTYRIYDYNRIQSDGTKRQLQIDKAIDVISIPDNILNKTHINKYFEFEIVYNDNEDTIQANIHGDYIFIIDGAGYFDNTFVRKGDFLMVTSKSNYTVKGKLKYQKTTF